eukprot:TRINITY_DN56649_c0_g1_i1.p1 TRINITY_DN56649_c0_g1~~TRINITY_DN56649_c0_g1_i1.p1  ORF type:complete len:543 (-),score=110.68 TRINITY_DN56649_c0_g1_i1:105-1733(-)
MASCLAPPRSSSPLKRLKADGGEVAAFDTYDVPNRCRELLQRIARMKNQSISPPWKWDIIELLDESRQQLREAREANAIPNKGLWQEVREAVENEQTVGTLPVGLRKQCEELIGKQETWLVDFDAELSAIIASGKDLRERLFFEDMDRAGWFSASGVSSAEVQRLLERHVEMHQRATRLARQLKLLSRSLQQQGAVSSRRRAFQAKTMGEKLQSSLVCLAAVAVAPVPGSSEMWLATTTMMWLDKDQACQHVVYEHPRDADTETILSQFQSRASKARRALAAWLEMPLSSRKNCVLIHNASVRRVFVESYLVNAIDGSGDRSADWTSALDAHPFGSVMKKALTMTSMAKRTDDDGRVVIGAQRLAVVPLPPKPDMNWGWRGVFSYGDTKVGDCRLRDGGIFSFICVDSGLRVGDQEEGERSEGALEETEESPTTDVVENAEDVDVVTVLGEEQDTVEFVNSMDEPMAVKVFEPGSGGHTSILFRNAIREGTIGPGVRRMFKLKESGDGETDYDVEIRVGNRRAKCEVVGGQVVFVDGLMQDG